MRDRVRLRVTARAALVLSVLAIACTAAPRDEGAPSQAGTVATGADSIVLERTPCYGTCPVYRLRIAENGSVRFDGRVREDSTFTASDSLAPSPVATLRARAERIGFFELPDSIRAGRELCSDMATDHPRLIVSIFQASTVKRVDYYTGCYVGTMGSHTVAPALVALRQFAAAIDSTARSSRWVVPFGIR